jgi:hypothetical protein
MIGFAFVTVGYLVGRWLVRMLAQRGVRPRTRLVAGWSSVVAGAFAGFTAWREAGSDGVFALFTAVSDALHRPLGTLGDLLTAALFAVTVLAVGIGIIVSALLVICVLGSILALAFGNRRRMEGGDQGVTVGFVSSSRPDAGAMPPAAGSRMWRATTTSYGRAVAAALEQQVPGSVEVRLCGTAPEHLHLTAEGVVADWDIFDGWSAMTLRGRHWYGDALVPPPDEISPWLREVGQQPYLGIGWPREWYATGEVEAGRTAQRDAVAQLAAISTSRRRCDLPADSVVSADPAPEV